MNLLQNWKVTSMWDLLTFFLTFDTATILVIWDKPLSTTREDSNHTTSVVRNFTKWKYISCFLKTNCLLRNKDNIRVLSYRVLLLIKPHCLKNIKAPWSLSHGRHMFPKWEVQLPFNCLVLAQRHQRVLRGQHTSLLMPIEMSFGFNPACLLDFPWYFEYCPSFVLWISLSVVLLSEQYI